MKYFLRRFGLCFLAALLGQPVSAQDDTPYVTLADTNTHWMYAWANTIKFAVFDDDLKTQVSVIGEGCYTKVYLRSDRHLTIKLLSTSKDFGLTAVIASIPFTVTPDMAEKTFALTPKANFFSYQIFANESAVDLVPMTYCPDLTGTLTLGGREASPYESTYVLLTKSPKQTDTISETARSVEPAERLALYKHFKMDPSLPEANGFPGFGVGSFRQGDWVAGTLSIAGDVGATGFLSVSTVYLFGNVIVSLVPDPQNSARRQLGFATGLFFASIGTYAAVKYAEYERAKWYGAQHDKKLADTLDVTP